jgi:hypothetical protein
MIAAYSDVVGTIALILAGLSLIYTWWSRRHEPEHQVRIRRALQRDERAVRLLPELRSAILNGLQFIDEDPRRPRGVVIPKQRARLDQLREKWLETRALVGDQVARSMETLDLDAEIDWLDSTLDSAEEVNARLDAIGERLRLTLRTFDEYSG